jgi:PHD-zinc-finger like domain
MGRGARVRKAKVYLGDEEDPHHSQSGSYANSDVEGDAVTGALFALSSRPGAGSSAAGQGPKLKLALSKSSSRGHAAAQAAEDEEDHRCSICHNIYADHDNPILVCDGGCGNATHLTCYGVLQKCKVCTVYEGSTAIDKKNRPRCWICGLTDKDAGLMKPFTTSFATPINNMATTCGPNGTYWVHMLCALTCSGVKFENSVLLEPLVSNNPFFTSFPNKNKRIECIFCRQQCKPGCYVKCASGGHDGAAGVAGCRNFFHTACAAKAGLRIDLSTRCGLGYRPDYFCNRNGHQAEAGENNARDDGFNEADVIGLLDGEGCCNIHAWIERYGRKSSSSSHALSSSAGTSGRKNRKAAGSAQSAPTSSAFLGGVGEPGRINAATAGKLPHKLGYQVRRAILPEHLFPNAQGSSSKPSVPSTTSSAAGSAEAGSDRQVGAEGDNREAFRSVKKTSAGLLTMLAFEMRKHELTMGIIQELVQSIVAGMKPSPLFAEVFSNKASPTAASGAGAGGAAAVAGGAAKESEAFTLFAEAKERMIKCPTTLPLPALAMAALQSLVTVKKHEREEDLAAAQAPPGYPVGGFGGAGELPTDERYLPLPGHFNPTSAVSSYFYGNEHLSHIAGIEFGSKYVFGRFEKAWRQLYTRGYLVPPAAATALVQVPGKLPARDEDYKNFVLESPYGAAKVFLMKPKVFTMVGNALITAMAGVLNSSPTSSSVSSSSAVSSASSRAAAFPGASTTNEEGPTRFLYGKGDLPEAEGEGAEGESESEEDDDDDDDSSPLLLTKVKAMAQQAAAMAVDGQPQQLEQQKQPASAEGDGRTGGTDASSAAPAGEGEGEGEGSMGPGPSSKRRRVDEEGNFVATTKAEDDGTSDHSGDEGSDKDSDDEEDDDDNEEEEEGDDEEEHNEEEEGEGSDHEGEDGDNDDDAASQGTGTTGADSHNGGAAGGDGGDSSVAAASSGEAVALGEVPGAGAVIVDPSLPVKRGRGRPRTRDPSLTPKPKKSPSASTGGRGRGRGRGRFLGGRTSAATKAAARSVSGLGRGTGLGGRLAELWKTKSKKTKSNNARKRELERQRKEELAKKKQAEKEAAGGGAGAGADDDSDDDDSDDDDGGGRVYVTKQGLKMKVLAMERKARKQAMAALVARVNAMGNPRLQKVVSKGALLSKRIYGRRRPFDLLMSWCNLPILRRKVDGLLFDVDAGEEPEDLPPPLLKKKAKEEKEGEAESKEQATKPRKPKNKAATFSWLIPASVLREAASNLNGGDGSSSAASAGGEGVVTTIETVEPSPEHFNGASRLPLVIAVRKEPKMTVRLVAPAPPGASASSSSSSAAASSSSSASAVQSTDSAVVAESGARIEADKKQEKAVQEPSFVPLVWDFHLAAATSTSADNWTNPLSEGFFQVKSLATIANAAEKKILKEVLGVEPPAEPAPWQPPPSTVVLNPGPGGAAAPVAAAGTTPSAAAATPAAPEPAVPAAAPSAMAAATAKPAASRSKTPTGGGGAAAASNKPPKAKPVPKPPKPPVKQSARLSAAASAPLGWPYTLPSSSSSSTSTAGGTAPATTTTPSTGAMMMQTEELDEPKQEEHAKAQDQQPQEQEEPVSVPPAESQAQPPAPAAAASSSSSAMEVDAPAAAAPAPAPVPAPAPAPVAAVPVVAPPAPMSEDLVALLTPAGPANDATAAPPSAAAAAAVPAAADASSAAPAASADGAAAPAAAAPASDSAAAGDAAVPKKLAIRLKLKVGGAPAALSPAVAAAAQAAKDKLYALLGGKPSLLPAPAASAASSSSAAAPAASVALAVTVASAAAAPPPKPAAAAAAHGTRRASASPGPAAAAAAAVAPGIKISASGARRPTSYATAKKQHQAAVSGAVAAAQKPPVAAASRPAAPAATATTKPASSTATSSASSAGASSARAVSAHRGQGR